MLLFRDHNWKDDTSPQEMEEMMHKWIAWIEGLEKAGKLLGANPLERAGKTISGKNGETVTDGPFAESKEAVGGYFLLKVPDFEEAVAIARGCPGLAYGLSVEVRPVAAVCARFKETPLHQVLT
ncbi:MAG: hypothetical protein JO331_07405 [Verrucomicrobia bacterium]|nr:hypothetical protein [Verrucomicrobiota bacterium]